MQRKISIKIISFSLLLCIIFSSIFSSYTSTYNVNAETDSVLDIVCDIVLLACTVGGSVVTGGTMTPLAFATAVAMSAKLEGDLFDYCSDNGDGTATINSDTIQMILDSSAYHVAQDGFSDSDILTYDNTFEHRYHAFQKGINSYNDSFLSIYDINSNSYICGKFDISSDFIIDCYATTDFKNYRTLMPYPTVYKNGTKLHSPNRIGIKTDEVSANFPLFATIEQCKKFITTGEGYKDAINYNPDKVNKLKYGTNYNPTYNGGSKTFNINRLKNFSNYYTKVINNNVNTDTDEILNILLKYILDTSEPEPETETPIEPDTSEVGDDLTETNDWLQKIYNRIGEFMNSFNSQKNKLNNLLESKFNELITAVKNTGKSDEPETEPETETETETETSTDKTDIIIENQEKSQGILESILTAIQDGFKDTVDELKKIRRWTALDTIFDGLDAVADWLDFVTKFFDNVTDGIGLLVSGFTDTVTELTKVFPFSIPITLVLIVQMFSAPPEPPKFELPLKLDAFNIDEKIVIDLSQFQVISVISRTFLTIIYCVGLYHLTFKIITAKKGG